MNVFEKVKLSTVNNLEIDVSALYLIAARRRRRQVVEDVVDDVKKAVEVMTTNVKTSTPTAEVILGNLPKIKPATDSAREREWWRTARACEILLYEKSPLEAKGDPFFLLPPRSACG